MSTAKKKTYFSNWKACHVTVLIPGIFEAGDLALVSPDVIDGCPVVYNAWTHASAPVSPENIEYFGEYFGEVES